MERIGLIPAAGTATRMGNLPCSKEILPLPSRLVSNHRGAGPKAVSENLVARLAAAGCRKIYWVLRPDKLDIIHYYARQKPAAATFAYLVMSESDCVPRSLDFAYPYVKGKRIMMGFGDICLEAMDVFQKVERQLLARQADVALGLFPLGDRNTQSRSDMVETISGGRITRILVKPSKTSLQYCWAVAVWQPSFTAFLHSRLKLHGLNRSPAAQELHLGELFQDAIHSGLTFTACKFDNQHFIDIGTPASWQAAASFGIMPGQPKKDGP